MMTNNHPATVECGNGGGIGHPPSVLYDANNWLRRRFEGGASVRLCFAEVKARPGTVVFDGPGGLKRRRSVYPGYKVRRKSLVSDIVRQFELFQRLLTCTNVACVRVPGWEADDVIATLARSQKGRVHIKSTDADFLQLANATIDRDKPFPVKANLVRTYKATVGDPSDCIPGLKGFGKGAWAKLTAADHAEFTRFFEGGPGPITLPKATANWLADPANAALARSYYQITALYDVPMSEIAANAFVGQEDPDGAEIIFKEFLL